MGANMNEPDRQHSAVGLVNAYRRSLRGSAMGYVASMTNVPVGTAQFFDVPPAGFEPALASGR